MRWALIFSLVMFGAAVPVASAIAPVSTVSTEGVTLRVPAGWHAEVDRTPTCDPERLIVASSAPIRTNRTGQLAPPPTDQVLVLLVEDRYPQDRPLGDLHRPARFIVAWNGLVHVKPICGMLNSPAYMRYFKTHSRYMGFIVYPTGRINADVRAATLATMDSLRVAAR